jgi:glutamate synthase (NADPH) large chain
MEPAQLAIYQKMFNISNEERREVIRVLAENEQEAVGSMGDDTPMPVLSLRVRPLFDFFRQQFAQVTNPPIDSLRERIVMSLQTEIGREWNIFEGKPEHARRVVMNSPVLSQRKLRQLLNSPDFGISHELLDLNYPEDTTAAEGSTTSVRAPRLRCGRHAGGVLSDRYLKPGQMPVHALLATGAVHHHLVREGLRCDCNIWSRPARRATRIISPA